MSSLQKFHRRTNGGVPQTWPATAIGGGNDIYGYWLGGASSNKLVVAPKSTETQLSWGAYTARNTVSTTNGLANTNTLAGFGQAAQPAAYYAKNLTTGGYNTWYLPAKDELNTLYSNRSATPFATANSFGSGNYYWSSTEDRGNYAWNQGVGSSGNQYFNGKGSSVHVRAVRRTAV
jgi:hypothetical protein